MLALAVVSSPIQAEDSINTLHFSGEPVGDKTQLNYHLEEDARRLLAHEPALAPLDDIAAALYTEKRVGREARQRESLARLARLMAL